MNTPLSHVLSRKNPSVTAVSPSASVSQAVRIMNQFHIGAVLITGEDGRLLGIFTERDVLSRVVDRDLDPRGTRVEAVMTTRLETVDLETTVEEAMALFMERRIRHLPVLNRGALSGMISIGDINRWLLEEHSRDVRELRQYIHGDLPAAV